MELARASHHVQQSVPMDHCVRQEECGRSLLSPLSADRRAVHFTAAPLRRGEYVHDVHGQAPGGEGGPPGCGPQCGL
eukprot:4532502-Ditylum_brightwellii.AAC.1